MQNIRKDYTSNGIEVPANIEQMVEDQTCQRQPSDRCWYSDGLGDKIAQAIHTVAATADKVLELNQSIKLVDVVRVTSEEMP